MMNKIKSDYEILKKVGLQRYISMTAYNLKHVLNLLNEGKSVAIVSPNCFEGGFLKICKVGGKLKIETPAKKDLKKESLVKITFDEYDNE